MVSYNDTFHELEEMNQAFDEVFNKSLILIKKNKDLNKRLKQANQEKRKCRAHVEEIMKVMNNTHGEEKN